MAREPVRILDAGDTFPSMNLDLVGGDSISLPGGLAGNWAAVLFYRGDF